MQSPKTITVAGTGSPIPVSTSHFGARWVRMLADIGNSAPALVGGDSKNAPAYPLAAGDSVPFYPNGVEPMGFYFLDEMYINPRSGDVVYVLYGG